MWSNDWQWDGCEFLGLAFAGVAARVPVGLRSRATGVARLENSLC